MENNAKCKICRRNGAKLFLKGERCLSQKCAMVKRPYPPGQKSKRKRGGSSEYGKELAEKQKLKNWYDLRERQFKKYITEVLEKRGKVQDAGALLMKKLEGRLDNVVFRMGFFTSRTQARQAVSHGHFLVNSKKIDAPSCQIKKGDKISIRPSSQKKAIFQNISSLVKKQKPASWIRLDLEKLEGEIIKEPFFEDSATPAEISSILEFYSR
jgi:small subunit ribosomal protein S4